MLRSATIVGAFLDMPKHISDFFFELGLKTQIRAVDSAPLGISRTHGSHAFVPFFFGVRNAEWSAVLAGRPNLAGLKPVVS